MSLLARSALRASKVVGESIAVTGGAALVFQQQQQYRTVTTCTHVTTPSAFDANVHVSSSVLVVPTLEALLRAARLLETAVLIVADYQTAQWRPQSDDSSSTERTYWEQETEQRLAELNEAQEAYSKQDFDPNLPLVERLDVKRQQKENMNRAAQQLAEAEAKLASSGGTSRKSATHQRAAMQLLDLCCKNGGVYIKIGQHLANLDYLIPEEYITVLSSLYDNTPRTDFADVRHVIREELGQDPEELFDQFDPEPIASASLAQVHVAYDKTTGNKLAIKVQHRGLRETAAGDMFALTTVVRVCEQLFTDFTWGWIADEIAPQLPKELDFINEGRNAERAAENLQETGLACVIPKVLWQLSSPRVLTMEFEEGFKATDVDAIAKAGLKKRDVAKLISSVFSSQVFLSSFVHCDPHPANVLVRAKNGKPEIVLVDHGLYRELDADFTVRYSRLWQSLMLADLGGIKDACHSLGVDQAYTLFAAMLTARPFDEIIERSKQGSLSNKVQPDSKADQAVIRGYAQRFLHNIFDLLSTVPRQLLLLLKANDCLRHIDYSLGSPTNTIVISGKYAARGLYQDRIRKSPSFLDQFRAWLDYMHVMVRIQAHDFGVWWMERRGKSLQLGLF